MDAVELEAVSHTHAIRDGSQALYGSAALVLRALCQPAFGRSGDPATDIAPLVALIGQPEAHFMTAGTVVADGGIWMGL